LTKLIAVSYDKQIVAGTFEYALNEIIDEMNLSIFKSRYKNDETGAPAYDPAILLKIILFAYSRGITSSRDIAQACAENVTFMALSADTRPHFTTIADFISSLEPQIAHLYGAVLTVCAKEGLIGRNLFAVDGCKIAANCSKENSGTRKHFENKRRKLEKLVRKLVQKHRKMDIREAESKQVVKKEKEAVQRLRREIAKLKEWLKDNSDKIGPSGRIKQSNLTDNDSAKMPTSYGVIQGYNGQAMVDSKRQVVVHAEVFGEGQEHGLLEPMIEGTRETLKAIGEKGDVFEETKLLADAGYSDEKNMKRVFEENIDAYIPDNNFRKRDPAFAHAEKYRKSIDRKHTTRKARWFKPSDFVMAADKNSLTCPAGNKLFVQNSNYTSTTGLKGTRYQGWKTKCRGCKLRAKCMRGQKAEMRSVVIFLNATRAVRGKFMKKMIEKLSTAKGRFYYSRRMGIVEPVFGNIRDKCGQKCCRIFAG
jgi:transposase